MVDTRPAGASRDQGQEMAMSTYRIESKAGVVFGEFAGETPQAAFAAMVAEGGAGVDSPWGTASDWIIQEVPAARDMWRIRLSDGGEHTVPGDQDAEIERYGVSAIVDWARETGLLPADESVTLRAVITPEGEEVTQF